MGKALAARNEEIFHAAVVENRPYGDIAEEWGLTKQAVWAIVQMQEKKLSGQDKQGELIDRIVYSGVQNWIVRHNMTIRRFCEYIGYTSASADMGLRRFLYGESEGNITAIRNILRATDMTFEQAFGLGANERKETVEIEEESEKFEKASAETEEESVAEDLKKEYIDISQLGLDLEEERKKRGLTQVSVAKELGISVQAYQRWENGLTRRISTERYEILSKIFSSSEDTVSEPDIDDLCVDTECAEVEESSTSKSKKLEIYKNISDLGIDLLEERINRGWSQREAAEKLGVSLLSYCKWETGKTLRVNRKSYRAIQRVFLEGK